MASVAATAGLLCTPRFAHAGYWTVEYTGSGTATNATERPDYSGFDIYELPWGDLSARIDNGGLHLPLAGSEDYSPGTAAAVSQGSIQTYAVWHPNTSNANDPRGNGIPSPPDLPPTNIFVFEQATVSGSAGGGDSYRGDINENSATFTMQNPLGGEPSANTNGRSYYQGATKWTSVDNASRATRVLLASRTLSASTTFSSSVQYGSHVSAEASVHYSVQVFERSAGITRPGAHDETADSDGTLHGDSIYSYRDSAPPLTDPLFFPGSYDIEIWNHFDGHANGEWHDPEFTWSPNGDRNPWPWLRHDWIELMMPFGTPAIEADQKWHGRPTGIREHNATLKVSDDIGFPIDAIYYLKLHDQVEDADDTPSRDFKTPVIVGHFYGDIKAGSTKGYREFTEVPGSWSFGMTTGSGSEIWSWFPVFNFTYSTPNILPMYPVQLEYDLPEGYHALITRQEVFAKHTYTWKAYDTGGQVFADPNDHSKRHTASGEILEDIKYDVNGIIPDRIVE